MARLIGRRASWGPKFLMEFAALALALLDRRTPWGVKAVVAALIVYLVSPIDFVPDFIPFLGWVDDAILVPLGLWFASRLVPSEAWQAARRRVGLDGGAASA